MGSHRRELEAVQGQGEGEWGKITDDEFDKMSGRRDQLAGKIQEHYGIAKDEAERQVDEWTKRDDQYWRNVA